MKSTYVILALTQTQTLHLSCPSATRSLTLSLSLSLVRSALHRLSPTHEKQQQQQQWQQREEKRNSAFNFIVPNKEHTQHRKLTHIRTHRERQRDRVRLAHIGIAAKTHEYACNSHCLIRATIFTHAYDSFRLDFLLLQLLVSFIRAHKLRNPKFRVFWLCGFSRTLIHTSLIELFMLQ